MTLSLATGNGAQDRSADGPVADVSVGVVTYGSSALSPLMIARLARRWRHARSAQLPAMPAMHDLLGTIGLGILTPVLDGLFTAGEAALGRPLEPGCGARLTADEQCLAALLLLPAGRCQSPSRALRLAVASARAMVNMTKRSSEPYSAIDSH